jgi:hypothetical protein
VHAEAIARDEHSLATAIVYGESELAIEPLEKRCTPFLVPVHENLSVRARTENVASFFKLTTKLGMIENLAVGRQYDLSVFVCQRLAACIAVEGAQPDVGEAYSPPDVEAVAIRSPVTDSSSHPAQ